MTLLILGLVLFLGTHSVRIFAEDWRSGLRSRLGEPVFKAGYSVLSLLGLVLIVWGFGLARQQPVLLWAAPTWARHLAALLTLPAFVFVAAGNVPGNAIKSRLKHPMVLGVKLWAFAHLLANSSLADTLLFGSFLVWAVLDFRSSRQRDRAGQVAYPPGRTGPTLVAVVGGIVAWGIFAFWAHGLLIGVRPFG
jgi:uncharacterized membrane protein